MGDVLMSDRRVRRVSFTGSTEVGRHLAEQAGRYLKRITLELGRQRCRHRPGRRRHRERRRTPCVFGRFAHQGQICMNSKRIVARGAHSGGVHTAVRRAGRKAQSTATRRSRATCIGPLINQRQRDKLAAQVERAVAEGAAGPVRRRGSRGPCYRPTVLGGVTPRRWRASARRSSGRWRRIIVADDAEEALDLANDSALRPLRRGAHQVTCSKGLELAERMETGAVHINDSSLHDEAQAPFGGVKDQRLRQARRDPTASRSSPRSSG